VASLLLDMTCRFSFNAGSTKCVYGCTTLAAKVAANTALAGGSGGLTTLLAVSVLGYPGDIAPMLNGILAGGVVTGLNGTEKCVVGISQLSGFLLVVLFVAITHPD
jgi:hypothetical protein